MIEEAEVVLHEGHEPDLIADFLDANVLAGEDLPQFDLASSEADAAAAGDRDGASDLRDRLLE